MWVRKSGYSSLNRSLKPWIQTRFTLENLLVLPNWLIVKLFANPTPNVRVRLLMDLCQLTQTLAFWTTDQLTEKYLFLLDLILFQPQNTAEEIIGHQLFWSEFQIRILKKLFWSILFPTENLCERHIWISLKWIMIYK